MAELPPIPCTWDGEAFQPARGWRRTCDQNLTVGQSYIVQPEEPRNMSRHRAYFAGINDSWQSLPDHLVSEYPSPEHLRHRALIANGYATQRDYAAASRAEALRLAAFLPAIDTYAVITIQGAVVRMWHAESQSVRAMGADRFKASCEAVERWIGDLLQNKKREVA